MAQHNQSGSEAEERVAGYLRQNDYKIIGQNWKTKWCEIDIIAKKDNCMHFIEVKYRTSDTQGGGYDYITPQKLRKMDLAARSWVEMNDWNKEYVLSAAEVSGPDFDIEFIEQV